MKYGKLFYDKLFWGKLYVVILGKAINYKQFNGKLRIGEGLTIQMKIKKQGKLSNNSKKKDYEIGKSILGKTIKLSNNSKENYEIGKVILAKAIKLPNNSKRMRIRESFQLLTIQKQIAKQRKLSNNSNEDCEMGKIGKIYFGESYSLYIYIHTFISSSSFIIHHLAKS